MNRTVLVVLENASSNVDDENQRRFMESRALANPAVKNKPPAVFVFFARTGGRA
jgi:hypothetical protein